MAALRVCLYALVGGLLFFTAATQFRAYFYERGHRADSDMIYYVHSMYGLTGAIVGALAGTAQAITSALNRRDTHV